MAFGLPTIAVDTHLFRVSNRLPLARGATPLAVELGLGKVIPQEFLLHAHHWLDPARALRLQGQQARLPALPDRRSASLRAEDRLAPCGERQARQGLSGR